MPTLKQKKAFKETVKALETSEGLSWNEIMLKSGYSPASAVNPGKNLVNTRGFQILLNKIDDEAVLKRFMQILMAGKDSDSISAGRELMKLKGRYIERHEVGALKDREAVLEDA